MNLFRRKKKTKVDKAIDKKAVLEDYLKNPDKYYVWTPEANPLNKTFMDEELKLPGNHISQFVKQNGQKSMAERLCSWMYDIMKLDPENKTTDEVIQFLSILRNEVAKGKFTERTKQGVE